MLVPLPGTPFHPLLFLDGSNPSVGGGTFMPHLVLPSIWKDIHYCNSPDSYRLTTHSPLCSRVTRPESLGDCQAGFGFSLSSTMSCTLSSLPAKQLIPCHSVQRHQCLFPGGWQVLNSLALSPSCLTHAGPRKGWSAGLLYQLPLSDGLCPQGSRCFWSQASPEEGSRSPRVSRSHLNCSA